MSLVDEEDQPMAAVQVYESGMDMRASDDEIGDSDQNWTRSNNDAEEDCDEERLADDDSPIEYDDV